MGSSSTEQKGNLPGFMTALSSAACEWVLIFFLLVNAAFSYLLTKFAQHCELQLPCMLCIRQDNSFGKKRPEAYCSTLCSSHRLEISSLVFCHTHGKLADIRGLCEACLLSYATQNKSNSESYRLLAGKLGLDLGYCDVQSPLLKDGVPGSLGTELCSCCSKPCKSRPNSQRLPQLKPLSAGVTKPELPLPNPSSQSCLKRQNGQKKMRNRIPGSTAYVRLGTDSFDPLYHVGYKQLKIASDFESEVLQSDDDNNGRYAIYRKPDSSGDFAVKRTSEIMRTTMPKQTKQSQTHGSLLVDLSPQPEGSEPQKPLESHVSIWHGLRELNWQQIHQKSNFSVFPELISLNVQPLSSCKNFPVGTTMEHQDFFKTTDLSNPTKSAPLPNYLDSGDVSKSVFSEAEDPFFPAKQQAVMGFDGDHEELKPMISESSSAQRTTSPLGSPISRVQTCVNEAQVSDAPNSREIQLLPKPNSPERSDSGLEFPDESNVRDVEGENFVDKLKRQIAYDKKCMSALYKELEEERNASAIAANQAMAMITRLQEEKAAVHMEALQYLRMMEEQAEYDVEALQKANDLLAEKEKDIQDLEAELEFFRNELGNVLEETCNLKLESKTLEMNDVKSVHGIENTTTSPSDSIIPKEEEDHGRPVTAKISSTKFEEEKSYISESLKKLEEKLHEAMNNGDGINEADNGHLESEGDEANTLDRYGTDESCIDGYGEKHAFPLHDESSLSNGSITASDGNHHLHNNEKSQSVSHQPKLSFDHQDVDLIALRHEILDLRGRLKALEEDNDFLKHTSHTLQNGNEGLQYIEEIAHHLQELREIGRCLPFPQSPCRAFSQSKLF